MNIHANLDCEATWAGIVLPERVKRRISAAAALLAAFGDDCAIWAPAAVDPARLLAAPRWRIPAMYVGVPPVTDLAWADPTARAANDRRLALAVNAATGSLLPGARAITSLAELDACLRARADSPEPVIGSNRERAREGAPVGSGPREGSELAPWVAKAPWTAAGRDRCHGRGPATGETRVHVERLLARFGALVFEPWLDRVLDVGTCATVSAAGTVVPRAPHTLVTDARGGFLGIRLAAPDLTTAERDRAAQLVDAAGAALHGVGYAGPFTVDAFVHREGDARRFHPLCEINARHTFGSVAHALAERLGTSILGFGPPPAGATVLVAPTATDPLVAWVST